MFSLDTRLLQRSLFVFIKANELSLDSVIVDRLAVFISFNWLKLLSLSQDVIGRVNAILSKTAKLGYNKLLQFSKDPSVCQELLLCIPSILVPLNNIQLRTSLHGLIILKQLNCTSMVIWDASILLHLNTFARQKVKKSSYYAL